MEWRDEGIVLGVRRHGERDAVVEALTREHGRHLGLVRSGRSRRHAATLQVGNTLDLTWRARLDEHLGHFIAEPLRDRAARLVSQRLGPATAQLLAAHVRLLPERDTHPELFETMEVILDHVADGAAPQAAVVRFELNVLEDLGFGLDLSECALTGATQDLAYVSPRTGRAASRAAGAPYADRLLVLPGFLSGLADPDDESIRAGFRLTGHFLRRDVWGPRRVEPPEMRDRLIAAIGQPSHPAG